LDLKALYETAKPQKMLGTQPVFSGKHLVPKVKALGCNF